MRGQEVVHIGSRYGSKDSYLVSQSVYDVVLVGTGTIRYICRYLVPPRFFDAWLMQVKIPQSSYIPGSCAVDHPNKRSFRERAMSRYIVPD